MSCPGEDVAVRIGRDAVEARLAACAHVAPIRSVYRWAGAVHDEAEWTLTLKTRRDLAETLADTIRKAHPYELPEIMFRPVGADDATAAWIGAETT